MRKQILNKPVQNPSHRAAEIALHVGLTQFFHQGQGGLRVTYPGGKVRTYGPEGDRPWADIKFVTWGAVRAVVANQSLGFGDGFSRSLIEVKEDDLRPLINLIALNRRTGWLARVNKELRRRAPNWQRLQRRQIAHHYDAGNDYFDLILGRTGMYSCAFFKTEDLDQAQYNKISLSLKKLRLKRGQRLLDIGCGWGMLAIQAAKQYGVHVLGITLSKEQLKGAQELAEREGVSHLVEFRLIGYQQLAAEMAKTGEQFERIVSVGMFEHVGRHNQAEYFKAIKQLLADGGVSLLHTITKRTNEPVDPWVSRRIFPGGHLPTLKQLMGQIAAHGFRFRHAEDFHQHYAKTLQFWTKAHRAHRNDIIDRKGKAFYRARLLWLIGSTVAFTDGDLGLIQIVFTKGKIDWPLDISDSVSLANA
jgi:cyclopropane-fatty-acyl-phospholipid synthase